MIFIEITGKVPAKSNSYELVRQKGRCAMVRAKDVSAYQTRLALIGQTLARNYQGIPFKEGRVELWVIWHRLYHDGRRRDTDNLLKGLKDSLNKIIWTDDSQVSTIHMETCYDAEEEEWLDLIIQHDPIQPSSRSKRTTRTSSTTSRSRRESSTGKPKSPASINSGAPPAPS